MCASLRHRSIRAKALKALQVLLSAALDPPPAPTPTGVTALAAALRRALRLPGAADDADAALPKRRRRRVPPVRPQFPVKMKKAVVVPARRPRPAKNQVTVVARKPWQLPRLWSASPASAADGAAPEESSAVPVVTPFSAQVPAPAAAEQQMRSASAAGDAPPRPLDAHLAAARGPGSGTDGSRSPWTLSQLWGSAARGAVKQQEALETAAVASEAEKVAGTATPVKEEPILVVPAVATAEQQQATPELRSGTKDSDATGATGAKLQSSGSSAGRSQAADMAPVPQTAATAPAVGRRMLPLHQRKWPLPNVWLSGRDPWGKWSQQSAGHHANGAAVRPAAGQLLSGPRPAGVPQLPLNGTSSGIGNGVSNGAVAGALAQFSRRQVSENGTIRLSLVDRAASNRAAAVNGVVSPRRTISANAAAGLLDAQPPVASQRTAARPFADSNGLAAPRPPVASQRTEPRPYASSNGLAAARPPVASQRTAPRPFASSNGLAPVGRGSLQSSAPPVSHASLNGSAKGLQLLVPSDASTARSADGMQPAAAAMPADGEAKPVSAANAEAEGGSTGDDVVAHTEESLVHTSLAAVPGGLPSAPAARDVTAAAANNTALGAAKEGGESETTGEQPQPKGIGIVQRSAGIRGAVAHGAEARQAFRSGSPVRSLLKANQSTISSPGMRARTDAAQSQLRLQSSACHALGGHLGCCFR